MNRSEYLETKEGQINEKWKRFSDKLYLEIKQEPGSKKSLTREGKRKFRSYVQNELNKKKRRAFRGDIILEIDFFTTKDNPPPIQALSKNYLDLLHKPIPKIDALKKILFKDDNQIKILIANYHIDKVAYNEPKIRIKAYRYSHFIKDIELADKILRGDFDDYDFKEEDEDKLDDYFEELKDLKGEKENQLYKSNEFLYKLIKNMLMERIQREYLKNNNLSVHDIVEIFRVSPIFNEKYSFKEEMKVWARLSKKHILTKSNCIDLKGSPAKKGDTKLFRKNLRKKLIEFKTNYKILFPLLHPVSIVVFYTPPADNIIDLDNLAKHITPFVAEIFEPPLSLSFIKKKDLEHLNRTQKKKVELSQKFPKNGISNYQLMHIPRTDDTPKEGVINFFITNGFPVTSNIWWTVDNLIDKWED